MALKLLSLAEISSSKLSLSLLSDDSDEDEDASVPCRLIAGDPFSTQIVTAAQVFTALDFLIQLIGGLLAALPGLTGEASRPGWNEVMILFSPTGEKVPVPADSQQVTSYG